MRSPGAPSVTFLPGLTPERAAAYWRDVARAAEHGRAGDDRGAGRGWRSLASCRSSRSASRNQPHRAEIAKLLVHSRARRRGVGASLMRAAEDAARTMGRTLLNLDTAKGDDAERLYMPASAGGAPARSRVFALAPSGQLATTVLFWKRLD